MNKVSSWSSVLERYSYQDGELEEFDMPRFLSSYLRKQLGKGFFSRVFRIEGQPWVVKEGRWDLDIALWKNWFVTLPAQSIQQVLKTVGFRFQPTPKEIKNQFAQYKILERYFGYGSSDPAVAEFQKKLRPQLLDYMPHIEKKLRRVLHPKVKQIISSSLQEYNFLPEEYTLYGPSISPANNNKKTVYIVQRYVSGKTLYDYRFQNLSKKNKQTLILFLYLMMVLYVEKGLLVDVRPRYPITEMGDWFFCTDNIIINRDKVMFIDTRWLWDTKSNIIKRGLLIPELIIESMKHYINYFAEHV